MVETAAGNQHGRTVDASVLAKGMHRHAARVLQNQHVPLRVPDHGPYLLKPPGDLDGGPPRRDRHLVPRGGDARAAFGQGEGFDLGGGWILLALYYYSREFVYLKTKKKKNREALVSWEKNKGVSRGNKKTKQNIPTPKKATTPERISKTRMLIAISTA